MKAIDIIWYIWQLPQNLCGLAWKAIKKNGRIIQIDNEDTRKVKAEVWLMKAGGGVTLGKYIFISQTYTDQTSVIKHECGHVKQSLILGPLYLIVIGIPSILHAWLNGYIGCCDKSPEGYSHFFSEKWADKLMGL